METSTTVDTELLNLNIPDQLRANSSFMKILATLFHYGNQAMNAGQIVIAVRALNLLPLRGGTPKSTIQGIISTSRRIARDLKILDPFRIDKDGTGRQAKYAISDQVLNGTKVPEKLNIPDKPIILHPVGDVSPKRQRKQPVKHPKKKKTTAAKQAVYDNDVEMDSDEESTTAVSFDDDEGGEEGEGEGESPHQSKNQDTIINHSLVYCPPTSDNDYIDPINFTDYSIASHFAVIQQKGYSYPRFRSHEKIKIPKAQCEDKFRVADISKNSTVIGRLFVIADGHGGSGCSEYFVQKTPDAVEKICSNYDPLQLCDLEIQKKLGHDIKMMVESLDNEYLERKRQQLKASDKIDNDGCTLILNIFLGEWLINVNVGDSRTVLVVAPEPENLTKDTCSIDPNYNMDVAFASQDHKPYLEHLARHVLENGGEFVDSYQSRAIKVELDTLNQTHPPRRSILKNARIRPKDKLDSNVERIPSLNVARSCGDLDFKMDSEHRIITCEPDVTFIQISKKQKQRYFLLMGTDGTFDYMYEEMAERQNKAVAKALGPMIEEGEKMGEYLLEEEQVDLDQATKQPTDENGNVELQTNTRKNVQVNKERSSSPMDIDRPPLLYRELNEQELKERKIKERTLVVSARYFVNRECVNGFFASTLQEYDDCTVILVEV